MFGDQVSLTYFDIDNGELPQEYAQLIKQTEHERGYVFYPLAFVNNQLAAVGTADGFQIIQAVRKALES